jgi:hypothetical protein
MNRSVLTCVALLAACALLVPASATAQRPDPGDRICERDPSSPRCERAQEIDDRRDASRCAAFTNAVTKAKKAVAKRKAKLKTAKTDRREASGKRQETKAAERVKKAKKRVKKAKKSLRAARGRAKACAA